VAAVIPYWNRFLERFPNAASLAAGREEDVLALWSGLGYYRRARALREGAIAVMERHGGRVPDDVETLMGLPGIGRYTAGAVASLAFGRQSPVVDGNVKRVYSRLFGIRGTKPATDRACWTIAATLVRGGTPGDWNQAVMELGATVCTPRAPRCSDCPVARSCRARALGRPEAFPAPTAQRESRTIDVAVAWIERRGRVLLERFRPGGPFRGAWDLPATVVAAGESPARAIVRTLSARQGVSVRAGAVVLNAKHAILSNRLVIHVMEADAAAIVPRRAAFRWAAIEGLGNVAISGATAKIARGMLAHRRSHDRRSSASPSESRGRSNA
jgi:A/G-specific adenine glycosylase